MKQQSPCSTTPALRDGYGTTTPDPFAVAQADAAYARLRIVGLPVKLRPLVESAMVVCLPTPGIPAQPGVDPLTTEWCTRWRRSDTVPRAVDCDQALSGARKEFLRLSRILDGLGSAHGFDVELKVSDLRSTEDGWWPSRTPRGSVRAATGGMLLDERHDVGDRVEAVHVGVDDPDAECVLQTHSYLDE